MNLPVIVELLISLVFIYLILSLIASNIAEYISTIFQWRAIHLRKSIEIFLAGDARNSDDPHVITVVNRIYGNPAIKNLSQEAKGFFSTLPRKIIWMSADILRARKSIYNNRRYFDNMRKIPSDIPADIFAKALVEELKLPNIIHYLQKLRLEEFKNQHLQKVGNILDKLLRQMQSIELSDQMAEDIKEDFKTLSSEYLMVVKDFKHGIFDIDTSVIRMKDSLNKYIENLYSLQEIEIENRFLTETCKRLQALQKLLFPSVEEAIIIGRLKPSISEIVQLMSPSNAIYNDIEISLQDHEDQTYQTIREWVNSIPPVITKKIESIAKQAQYKAKSDEEGIKILIKEIKESFDSSMQAAADVDKRNTEGVAILIGIAVAFGINADTFHIIDSLSKDPVMRSAIVNKSEETIEKQSDSTNLKNIDTQEILRDTKLPIGWTNDNLKEQINRHPIKIQEVPIFSLLTMYIGWIISGVAIGKGPSFWFDLLGQAVNIKNANQSKKTTKKSR